MNDDPYVKLASVLGVKKDTERQLSNIGTVVSTSPLKIEIGELVVEEDNLWKSSNMERFIKGERLFIQREGQHFIILARVVKL